MAFINLSAHIYSKFRGKKHYYHMVSYPFHLKHGKVDTTTIIDIAFYFKWLFCLVKKFPCNFYSESKPQVDWMRRSSLLGSQINDFSISNSLLLRGVGRWNCTRLSNHSPSPFFLGQLNNGKDIEWVMPTSLVFLFVYLERDF